ARVRQERRNAGLAARRVVPVDEVAERVQRRVLGEGHTDCELASVDREQAPGLVEDETEHRAVDGVDREAGRAPMPSACDELAEQRDVRVVAAEHASIQRLLQPPQRRRRDAGEDRARAAAHVTSETGLTTKPLVVSSFATGGDPSGCERRAFGYTQRMKTST